MAQPEEPAASRVHTASSPRNDIIDLTADDDDVPVKVEPSEFCSTSKQDKGRGRAEPFESRAISDDDEGMSKEDIVMRSNLTTSR